MSEPTGAPMSEQTRTPAQQRWDKRYLKTINDETNWMRSEEVAASVAALAERVTVIERALIAEMRLAALESPAAAPEGQGRTPECIERFIDILTEHLETETKPERIEAFTLYRDLAREELARKAAAPEPVCQCGHPLSDHIGPIKTCCADGGDCPCMKYVHAEPPAAVPDAAPTDDAIEEIITLAYLYGSARCAQGVEVGAGRDSSKAVKRMLNEWDALVAAIRAYGRDGAR